MKDDHVTVDVTHEEDEAIDDPELTTHPDADGDRWYVGQLKDPGTPEERERQAEFYRAAQPDWGTTIGRPEPEVLHVAGYKGDTTISMLLAEASVRELLEALRAKGQNVIVVPPPADLRPHLAKVEKFAQEAAHAMGDRSKGNPEKPEQISETPTPAYLAETIAEVSAEMLSLGDRFDPETERMTRRQQQGAIASIAYNVYRLAEAVKRL